MLDINPYKKKITPFFLTFFDHFFHPSRCFLLSGSNPWFSLFIFHFFFLIWPHCTPSSYSLRPSFCSFLWMVMKVYWMEMKCYICEWRWSGTLGVGDVIKGHFVISTKCIFVDNILYIAWCKEGFTFFFVVSYGIYKTKCKTYVTNHMSRLSKKEKKTQLIRCTGVVSFYEFLHTKDHERKKMHTIKQLCNGDFIIILFREP